MSEENIVKKVCKELEQSHTYAEAHNATLDAYHTISDQQQDFAKLQEMLLQMQNDTHRRLLYLKTLLTRLPKPKLLHTNPNDNIFKNTMP